MRRLFIAITGLILLSALLAGCTIGNETANKIYNHLEKAVGIEQGFLEYQKQLIDKEQKEQDLYKAIVNLKMDKFDEIVSKSKQASDLASERKRLIQNEKHVMDQAYEEFAKVKPLAKQLKKDTLQNKAEQVIEIMDKRHSVYNNLFDDYVKSIDLDQKLYQMLQNKESKQEDLAAQVNKINDIYKDIEKEKQKFNHYTENYNNAKKDFYKSAGLTIKGSNN
ncbi:MAG TPA: YkyA family protein [Bacillales bacterium]|nr:YkyA family protein [Bacillales bacterium]